jgi:hypothetical protein
VIVDNGISQNAKWTGYSQFAGNLRQTGLLVPSESVTHPQEAPPFRAGLFTFSGRAAPHVAGISKAEQRRPKHPAKTSNHYITQHPTLY